MPSDRWEYGDRIAEQALELVVAVRDLEPEWVHREIARLAAGGHLPALVVALAAMVPDDVPVADLLEWTDDLDPRRQATGITAGDPAAYPPCDPVADRSPAGCASPHGTPARRTAGCAGAGCRAARRDYDAAYHRLRRARKRPATEAGEERRAS